MTGANRSLKKTVATVVSRILLHNENEGILTGASG
jgi:hypothetical protein